MPLRISEGRKGGSAILNVYEIYAGSNGEATKALYAHLATLGDRGLIARDLFRACKASERAKQYSRRYKGEAYDKKVWSLGLLCECLQKNADALAIRWGWKQDPSPPVGFPWVLYIDLPNGQCSFHSATRGNGPDYPGEWDRSRTSAHVIVNFTQGVLTGHWVTVIDDGPVTMTPADLEHIAANVPTLPGTNVLSTDREDDYQTKLAEWKRKHRYRE
jgi:hypothetical protein